MGVSTQSTWGRSSPSVAIPSPPPPRERSSVTSRRSSAMSLSTSSRRWPPLPPPPPWRRATSFPTDRSSPSETRGSGAPRPSSSHPSLVWSPVESTRPPTTASWSVTSISVRICTPTPFCPEVPLCTLVLLTVCRRRSPPPQRGNTPYGSEDPSSPLSPPSSRCGSPSRSTTSPAHPSSTGNASKFSAPCYAAHNSTKDLQNYNYNITMSIC